MAAALSLLPSALVAQGIGMGIGMDDVRRVPVIGGAPPVTHDLKLLSGGYILLLSGGRIQCVSTASC